MEKYIPYEIGHFIKAPKGTPCCFLIEIGKIISLNEILMSTLEVFNSFNYKIYHFATLRSNSRIYILIFAIGNKNLIDKIKNELVKKIGIGNVITSYKEINEYLTINLLFPPTFKGKRAIILTEYFYEAFIKRLREKLGPGYEAILYYIGLEMGCRLCEEHLKVIGRDLEKLKRVISEIFNHLGLGILEWIDLNDHNAVLRIHNNFECSLFLNSGKASSHIVRGILTGWFIALFNIDDSRVRSIETKCIAKGDSYCEIVIMRL